MEITTI